TPTTYTVTFNSNGGSAVTAQTVEHGGLVTEPADPIKTGATFAGWYADAGLTDAWVFASDTVTASTTLYAKWTPTTYTVTFTDWDGTVLKTQTVTPGTAATAPADPTRTGYTFTGWDVPFTNVTGDLVVTATYTPVVVNTFTVTFRDWDGTVLWIDEVSSGAAATAPPAPTRTGYIFVAWDVSYAVVTSDLTVTAVYTPDSTIESPVAWETIGGVDYGRVAGAVRFDTAAEAALDAFPGGASTAVIAYGRGFADALAASPLAGAVDGPVLLTETGSLPAATADALLELGVTKVYIVGGTGVVSPTVVTDIQNLGITDIERLFGENRYITARKIAEKAVSLGASTTEAFLVRGDVFADALAVSSIAAQEKVPVLLTTAAALHSESLAFLTSTGTDDVYIAGGTSAVSAAVQSEVEALSGVDVDRWFGDNRYLTGAAVVRSAMMTWAIPMVDIGLASGENFPDALAGGAIMGYKHGLLLLTRPSELSAPTAALITENKATIESVEFFGGTYALTPAIPTAVQQLLQ
ncbi:MAG: cell wall-binding repeat-containing protein, partial [Coriobacteriia bacterium]